MTPEERERLVRKYVAQNESNFERMPAVWQRIARNDALRAIANGWRGNKPASAWNP